jgi:hypothetical protein
MVASCARRRRRRRLLDWRVARLRHATASSRSTCRARSAARPGARAETRPEARASSAGTPNGARPPRRARRGRLFTLRDTRDWIAGAMGLPTTDFKRDASRALAADSRTCACRRDCDPGEGPRVATEGQRGQRRPCQPGSALARALSQVTTRAITRPCCPLSRGRNVTEGWNASVAPAGRTTRKRWPMRASTSTASVSPK